MTAPRVLVIDDEADLRELLEITLVKMGLDVDTAGSLAAARRCLQQTDYALVLTDMRLPDGLGIELISEVSSGGRHTPIAVITAFGSADNAVAALKAGAFDYLAKPVALDQLRRMVQSALARASNGTRPRAGGGLAGGGPPFAPDRRFGGDARGAQPDRPSGAQHGAGCDSWRIGQRQGTGGARHPCPQPACRQTFCRRQLWRHPRGTDGGRVFRLPQRGVHRRGGRPGRVFPGRQRRHPAAG